MCPLRLEVQGSQEVALVDFHDVCEGTADCAEHRDVVSTERKARFLHAEGCIPHCEFLSCNMKDMLA